MNRKQVFGAVGLSALTVALVALPGSSARKSPESAATGQELSGFAVPREAQERIEALRQELAMASPMDGDNDTQVFVSSGNGWLGVGITEVTPDKVKALKLPAERGVVLGKIVPDSPAAKAGLKESDVVTEINGQRIEGTEQFRRMIREIPSGRTVQFTVWRDGHSQAVSVTLGKSEMRRGATIVAPAEPGSFSFQMPDVQIPPMAELFGGDLWNNSKSRLGIDAENLDGDFGNYFGAPEGEGILVRGVFPDSPAAKAGLKVGDVITSVNGDRVRSVGELREKIVQKREEKSVNLGLIRNKAPLSLSVELPPPAEKKQLRTGVRTSI